MEEIFLWLEGIGRVIVVIVGAMHGKTVTLNDITLELREIIMPCNLECEEESLSPDTEEERSTFKVDTLCDDCKTGIRICLVASDIGIRRLQQLLTEDVSLLCPGCSRVRLNHGRSQ